MEVRESFGKSAEVAMKAKSGRWRLISNGFSFGLVVGSEDVDVGLVLVIFARAAVLISHVFESCNVWRWVNILIEY